MNHSDSQHSDSRSELDPGRDPDEKQAGGRRARRGGANGAEGDNAPQRWGGGGAGADFPETNTRVCSAADPSVSPPPAETHRTDESGAAGHRGRAPGLRGSWGGSRLCEMWETPTPVGGKDGPPLPGAPWADARSQEVAGTPGRSAPQCSPGTVPSLFSE